MAALSSITPGVTAESLNGAGKTDILIRNREQNVCVCEFKVWNGQASFEAAVRQLISYTTPSDQHVALVIINRTFPLAELTEKIQTLTRAIQGYVRDVHLSIPRVHACLLNMAKGPLVLSVVAISFI